MKTTRSATLGAAVLAGLLCLPGTEAQAFEDNARGIYLEGGRAPHGDQGGTNSATLGYTLPWSPRQPVHAGALTSYWDFFVSQWHAPVIGGGGARNYTQIGAIYTWRYRFDGGRSPWFAEAGVGATLMDHLYRTPDRTFSTEFQFTEVLGVGRSFGDGGRHELALRVQHFSNAGIKKPNPGENFVRLRYSYRF